MHWLIGNIGSSALVVMGGAFLSASGGLWAAWRESAPENRKSRKFKIVPVGVVWAGAMICIIGALLGGIEQARFEREMRAEITGGDGYCYVMLAFAGVENELPMLLVHNTSKYPAYDVQIRIYDLEKEKAVKLPPSENVPLQVIQQIQSLINVGNIPPGKIAFLGGWRLTNNTKQGYNIFISARNRSVTQLLRLIRLNGRWVKAIKLYEEFKPEIILFQQVDPQFPRNSRGEVDW